MGNLPAKYFPNQPEKVVCADIRTLDYSVLRGLGEIDGLLVLEVGGR
ncbi:MAG: hypothetical protein WCG80_10555 [Spirochaetales bacterium]